MLHLNRPLLGGVPVTVPVHAAEIDKATLQRYLALLRAYPESELPLRQLDDFVQHIKHYFQSHDIFERGHQLAIDMKDQWRASSSQLLRCGTFQADILFDSSLSRIQLQIEQVVESYMLEAMHAVVFAYIRHTTIDQELHLLTIMSSMRHFTQADLGIRMELQCEQIFFSLNRYSWHTLTL